MKYGKNLNQRPYQSLRGCLRTLDLRLRRKNIPQTAVYIKLSALNVDCDECRVLYVIDVAIKHPVYQSLVA